MEMPFALHERTPDDQGATICALVVSLDSLTVGDFRRAHKALEASDDE